MPLLVYLVWRGFKRRLAIGSTWGQDARALRHASIVKIMLLALAFFALVLGAAKPSGLGLRGVEQTRGNYLFVVDVSRSMAARDGISLPTQLDRAKNIIRRTMAEVPEACFGIITFAGLAFPLTSLLCDRAMLEEALRYDMEVDRIPIRGSNIFTALGVALQRISNPQEIYRDVTHIVVFTDGGTPPSGYAKTLSEFQAQMRRYSLKVTIVGIGNTEGATIPLYDGQGLFTGEYATVNGVRYFTFLQESFLRDVAQHLDGTYLSESATAELVRILRSDLSSTGRSRDTSAAQDVSGIFYAILSVVWFVLVWKKHL